MRAAGILACLVLVASAAAGCSSQPGASGGQSTSRGSTATQVTVGGLATLTSVAGETLPGSDIGARALFDRVNASGGVDGRRINFVGTADDGGTSASDLSTAEQLVRRSGVFAIVPALTSTLGAASFLEAQGVPTLGYMADPEACGKSYLFDITGCSTPPLGSRVFSPAPGLVLAQGAARGAAAGTSVAVTIDDDSAGRSSVQACSGPFRVAGFKVVAESIFVPAGIPADYGPAVQKVMTSDAGHRPDVVWACDNFETTVGLTNALRGAGYRGLVYSPVTYDLRVPQVPALRETLQSSYSYTAIAPSEASTSALDQVRRDVHAVDPGAQLSTPVLVGYYAAQMFVQVLRRVGRDLTPQRFEQTANAGFTFGEPGGVCPVTFPLGHSEGSVGGGLVQLQGTQYQVVVPLLCRPMSDNVRY